MRSATAITYELDDMQMAAEELIKQIRKAVPLGEHSVAMLHSQPEIDNGELSAILSRELGFPVIGGTTAGAATLNNDGHHELAIVLHVLTADDCRFATAISDSMATEPKERIFDTYQRALGQLPQEDAPKLVVCVTSIMQSYSSDDGLAALSEASGALPVFGYVAADDFEFCKQQVFLSGEAGNDRIALLLIAGNVKPVFEVKNLAGTRPLSKRKVTKAHDNIICEIDGKPAYEYIKEFPFISDDTQVLWNYQFFVEMDDAGGDGIAVSRALNTYDKRTGEINCFANVPQNASIGLLYCDGDDVKATCEAALRELSGKLAGGGDYRYSTVLIASCSLRNLFLVDQKSAEGDLVKRILPPELVVSGLYAFGEISPTSVKDGIAINRFHNATLTMCAL